MHQRRQIAVPSGGGGGGGGGGATTAATSTVTAGCEGGCCSHQQKHPPAAPSSKNGWYKNRRRKGGASSSWSSRRAPWNEDLLIALIQSVSVMILIVCGVILLYSEIVNLYSPHKAAVVTSIFDRILQGNNNLPRSPHELYPKIPLTPSKIYTIPDSLPHIGDKSDHYAELRKAIDGQILPDIGPKYTFDTLPMHHSNSDQVSYDIYNCPEHPPDGYPFAWNLVDHVLKNWPPDDPTPRSKIYQGLCVFDYTKDYETAMNYRRAELPYVVVNDPAVQMTVNRWNSPGYMSRMLNNVRHRAEYSENNHFLYWNMPPKNKKRNNNKKPSKPWQRVIESPTNWTQPTKMLRMTYEDWLEHANVTDDSLLGPDQPHWYFRLIGCGETGPEGQCDQGSSEYLFDELTFFQPREHGNLYLKDPTKQKGIHCRFGMKGVIAENHFDGSRNAIAVLGGERRYILAHPEECPNLSLLPKGHPSARHSAVDWSNPDLDTYPEFGLAKGNEVVLQAGDVLYLPTNWFHYIISLSLNFQCNTRSGISPEYMDPIHQCGF